jgi:outer membrane lipoprotein-sorting protein
MIFIKTYGLFITVVFSTICISAAQDIEADLANINKKYEVGSMSMNVKYIAYPDHTASVPVEEESGQVKKKGTKIYYRIGSLESVSTDDYSLIVNHEEKTIFLLPKKKGMEEEGYNFVPANVKKLLSTCENVKFEIVSASQNAYNLECSLSEYSKIKIVFNSKTYFLEKMELFSRFALPEEETDGVSEGGKPPRLEIQYGNIESNPNLADNTFTYEKFLTEMEGKKGYQLKEEYRGYQFISQMEMVNN